MFVSALAVAALLCVPAFGRAQAYASSPYGSGNPYPSQYANPYAQQNPQYGYADPQAPAPQYAQPQYQQPQYQQPQYAAPQQPDAGQQPYAQPEPYATQPSPYPQQQDLAQAAPAQALDAGQLEQMLAPIALYPDALLAQILAASTYPAQVAVADQWLQQMRAQVYSSPGQIAAGANAQSSWDPSVKALTAFPDVLDMLDKNLEWTTALGNAYYNQPQDVMQTVQVLRQRAEQAGNLQPTPQEQVTDDQGYIDLAPANPDEVYVPTYDPWAVYGAPINPYPGFAFFGALADFWGYPIRYGLGFAVAAFDRWPFGLFAWGCDWGGHAVFYGHDRYWTRSASVRDWGLPHGGPRAGYGYGRGGDRWAGNRNDNRAWGGQNNYQHGPSDHRSSMNGGGRPQPQANYRAGYGNSSNAQRGSEFNRGNQGFGGSYTHPQSPGQSFARTAPQPGNSYGQPAYSNRGQSYARPSYGSGYAPRGGNYSGQMQAYASRPQAYSSPGYGYGYQGRSAPSYAARPGYSYASPSYRAPRSAPSYSAPSRSYNYGGSMARSSGFGGFGGRAPSSSYSAPKNFGGGRGFSSSAPRSFGGGHSSFSGGSHGSFGGGGHSSFGGGHSSSHSSGGGGHRR